MLRFYGCRRSHAPSRSPMCGILTSPRSVSISRITSVCPSAKLMRPPYSKRLVPGSSRLSIRFIWGKCSIRRSMGRVSLCTVMAAYMRVSFIRIRRAGSVVNCMPMATCISGTSRKIKNIRRDRSIGLACALRHARKTPVPRSNSTMAIGGVGCPMAKASTKNLMVPNQ